MKKLFVQKIQKSYSEGKKLPGSNYEKKKKKLHLKKNLKNQFFLTQLETETT